MVMELEEEFEITIPDEQAEKIKTVGGAILGSGIGGLNEWEEQHARFIHGGPHKVSPFVIPKMISNAAPGNVSMLFGLCGPNTAVSTACASAAHAIADALRQIQWGYA